jgi:prolyl-tRNA synthetase
MFSKFSHEFQTISGAGEDTIYVDSNSGIAINKEVYNDEVLSDLGIKKEDLVENKAVEVGNIFTLATRFSDALGLKYKTEEGEEKSVFMGSYGIGPGRLMGTIVEVLSDDKGIIWPESVAPFKVHLLMLGGDDNVRKESEELYNQLVQKGIEVLFDDRNDLSAGEKFADSDLIGIPFRVVVSKRSLADGGFEMKKRTVQNGKIVGIEELMNLLVANI